MLTSGTTHKMNGNFHSLIKLIFVLSPNKALLGWICATFEGFSNSLNFILIAHCIKEIRIRNKSTVKWMQMYFSYDCHTCFYVPFYLVHNTHSFCYVCFDHTYNIPPWNFVVFWCVYYVARGYNHSITLVLESPY